MRTADPKKAQRIIESAAQLFSERPYHEVRMEDVAAKAKVAKGTLYLHFKDKEDLYQALILEGLTCLTDQFEQGLAGISDPADKILALNRQAVDYFERNFYFLDLIQKIEAKRLGPRDENDPLYRSKLRFHELLAKILAEFSHHGGRGPDDFALEVIVLSGMMREVMQSLPRPWPKDLPERLTNLFLKGFIEQSGK